MSPFSTSNLKTRTVVCNSKLDEFPNSKQKSNFPHDLINAHIVFSNNITHYQYKKEKEKKKLRR